MGSRAAAPGLNALQARTEAGDRVRFEALIAGLVVVATASVVMAGWLLRQPLLVQVIPGASSTVFNTALSLGLGGLVVLALRVPSGLRWAHPLALAVIVVAAVTQLQSVLGVEFGTDWPSLHAWLADHNPHPGRTSLVTSTALGLFGAAVLALPRRRALARGLAVAVLLLALLNLAAYVFGLDGWLGVQRFPRMGILTALSVALLAGAVLRLETTPAGLPDPAARSVEDRIAVTSATLLAAVAVSVGVGTLAVMQLRLQDSLGSAMQLLLGAKIEQFSQAVRTAEQNARFVASRPGLHAAMRAVVRGNDAGAALERIADVLRSFADLGYAGVLLQDIDGRVLASAGESGTDPELAVTLATPERSVLMWDRALLLRTRLPMRDAGGLVGHALVVQNLAMLGPLFDDASELGRSAEMGLCARGEDAYLHCFPQRVRREVYYTPQRTARGERLPMTRALDGESAVARSIDYRGHSVHAAFAPVGQTGLAMVVKVDTADVYAPAREAVIAGVLLIALLVAGGSVLVRAQVSPLAFELARSEERWRTLIEQAPDAMLVVGEDGRIVVANVEAERLFGYARHELEGCAIESLVPESARAGHRGLRERYTAAPTRRPMGSTLELHARRSDGSEVPVEVSLSPIAHGHGYRIVASIRDIRERRAAEAALRQKNEELTRVNEELEAFASSVSHDLRAPLRAIDGFASILAEDLSGRIPAESAGHLDRVRAQALRMNQLIEDLLRLARLSRHALEQGRVNLRRLASECAGPLLAEARAAGRDVAVDIGELGECDGDAILLRQALQNLLANAFKYTRDVAQARISVEASRGDGFVVLEIRDNGVGFDMRHAGKLFRPFQRLHSPREFDGTGLGLSIVRRIANRHGGSVTAHGEVGKGAVFRLTLPEKGAY